MKSRVIPLAGGQIAIVDDEDFEIIAEKSWYVIKGYAFTALGGVTVGMSRMVMRPPPGFKVDHINHDILDNRRCNLRLATDKQNVANRRPAKGRKYLGVFVDKRDGHYWARCQQEYLGVFETEEEAARAYDKAAKEKYGEFAYLNFP